MDATVSEPCKWEISKLSMRRGGSGNESACSSASTIAFELGFNTRKRCSKEWRAFFSTNSRKACFAPRCGIRISTRLRGGSDRRALAENVLGTARSSKSTSARIARGEIGGVEIELFEQHADKNSAGSKTRSSQ